MGDAKDCDNGNVLSPEEKASLCVKRLQAWNQAFDPDNTVTVSRFKLEQEIAEVIRGMSWWRGEEVASYARKLRMVEVALAEAMKSIEAQAATITDRDNQIAALLKRYCPKVERTVTPPYNVCGYTQARCDRGCINECRRTQYPHAYPQCVPQTLEDILSFIAHQVDMRNPAREELKRRIAKLKHNV